MDVKLVLLASLVLVVMGVAGAKAKYSPNLAASDGCIARKDFITATIQDEMDMWICRNGYDIIVKVRHSAGRCELRINDPALDEKWLDVELKLNDTIVLFANGIPFAPRSGCAEHLEMNTAKIVTVDNSEHLLHDCSEGPAIYQISQALEDVLVPWYEEEVRLIVEPRNNAHIAIEVGGQEFVVCFSGTHIAAQDSASACTAALGTSDITLIIPKSNKFIKVITSDGKEAVTQITNGADGVPPKVKKTSIAGTVTMKQCLPHCDTAKHIPDDGPADTPEACPDNIPEDGSSTGYMVPMVIFLLLSAGLTAALLYLVIRNKMCGINAGKRPSASHPDDPGPGTAMMAMD